MKRVPKGLGQLAPGFSLGNAGYGSNSREATACRSPDYSRRPDQGRVNQRRNYANASTAVHTLLRQLRLFSRPKFRQMKRLLVAGLHRDE